MKRRAFTLVELLVVMGIMGLLGTISVGGYRAMQRGMEDRGVMQNVNSFIRTAYQRAQVDRQPVAIYFWNETLRSATDDQNEIVVGKAVAIRRHGRFSAYRNNMLIDEFADLDLTYPKQEADEGGSGSSQDSAFYVYPMEKMADIQNSTRLVRTLVEGKVKESTESVRFLSKDSETTLDGEDNALKVPSWGFVIKDAGNVTWMPGMAYGMEFMRLELPHGYIFGSQRSEKAENPVMTAGTIVFYVGIGRGDGLIKGGLSGRSKIEVCALRPDGSGGLKPDVVAESESPEEDL